MGNHENNNAKRVIVPDIVEQPCGLYPGIEAFSSDYGADDYCDWIEQSNGDPLPTPLVLYLQSEAAQDKSVPAVSMGRPDQARAIEQELRLQGALFDSDRPLRQLIFSDSIANRWSEDHLYRLVAVIQDCFFINQDSLNSWCACAGGLTPPVQRLRLLRVLGFNHIRLKPEKQFDKDMVGRLVTTASEARRLGFEKVVVDLRQLADAVPDRARLIESLLLGVQPERVRVFPGRGESRGSFEQRMMSQGYRNIGLDWFLREQDSWWSAKGAGRLYWTPLGYSELQNPDVIGVGPGALSTVCAFYGVNTASWQDYSACLDDGILPIVQGTELEDGDVLRREIIAMILALSCIRVSAIENKWGIRFEHFFARESELLRSFEQNNWLQWRRDSIEINTRAYRELVEICRVFGRPAGNPLTRVPRQVLSKVPEHPSAPKAS